MKIYVDEELIYELSDIQKRVIKNDIQEDDMYHNYHTISAPQSI